MHLQCLPLRSWCTVISPYHHQTIPLLMFLLHFQPTYNVIFSVCNSLSRMLSINLIYTLVLGNRILHIPNFPSFEDFASIINFLKFYFLYSHHKIRKLFLLGFQTCNVVTPTPSSVSTSHHQCPIFTCFHFHFWPVYFYKRHFCLV